MPKKILVSMLLSVLLFPGALLAEKFSSISDYTIKDTTIKIPAGPSTQKIKTAVSSVSTIETSRIDNTPEEVPDISSNQMKIAPLPKIRQTEVTSMFQSKNPKITVPTFEKQLNALLKEQEIKLKKKMTLIESIMNEIKNYGLYIVLILVLLTILYAIHKDKPQESTHLAAKPEEDLTKKDLWHDEF
ncbi:MAG TPA: hypothetical protein PLU24_02800 [Candidatus Omnitrophota bacterium]|nr:hypothetical protein [Candidatus Omnitrophota bacterium]